MSWWEFRGFWGILQRSQKNKNYGTNDLSSILEGNAGIDAAYDMRGESIFPARFSS